MRKKHHLLLVLIASLGFISSCSRFSESTPIPTTGITPTALTQVFTRPNPTTTPTHPNPSISLAPQPYLQYQVYGSEVITDLTMPPVLPNGYADYTEIYTEHDLCSLIASGKVDEVWIWAGNGDGVTKGHMLEWTTAGPEWEEGLATNCGKVVTTMTYNYLREVDVALESYHHRLEGLFGRYFTCDFSTATWPWAGSTTWSYSLCGSLLSDRYGIVARPFAGNDQIGACGDAHHPPNILGDQDYSYSDTTTVQSICPSWSQDGSAVPVSLNCQAWGCTHWGFHMWWMQNVPGLDNINRDRNGNPQPNWWSYMFDAPSSESRVQGQTVLPQSFGNAWLLARSPRFSEIEPQPGFSTRPPENGSSYSTEPEISGNTGLLFPTSLASRPAVITRTVYVLYFPGYGGSPRANVDILTTELIGLLNEATIYHGYEYSAFRGSFLGQDGGNFAGQGCTSGTEADNVHIHLEGLRTDVEIIGYQIEDSAGGGLWNSPCEVSNWLLHVVSDSPGQADLYFKPFRVAPDDTIYMVIVQYNDGTSWSVGVIGTQVQP